MLEQLQVARGENTSEIRIPMDRSDVSEYVGLSLAAVSRSFASLASRGIIKGLNRHHLKIVDRDGFEKIVAGGTVQRSGRKPSRK
jgi:CRP-like cAMP-binding protein